MAEPLSPSASGQRGDLGSTDGVEAVDDGDADLDFGRLAALRRRAPKAFRGSRWIAIGPKATAKGIRARVRLRIWHRGQRFLTTLPECQVARRVSFLASAAGQLSFQGRPFLRIGMIAVRERRVSSRSVVALNMRGLSTTLPFPRKEEGPKTARGTAFATNAPDPPMTGINAGVLQVFGHSGPGTDRGFAAVVLSCGLERPSPSVACGWQGGCERPATRAA